MHQANPIRNWSVEDRPREKLFVRGSRALSNAELLAVLIQSGNQKHSALDLANQILVLGSNRIGNLSKLTIHELQHVPGIGQAKASIIHAAFELAQRIISEPKAESFIIRQSSDAYELLRPMMDELRHEEFWVLLLNRSNKLMHRVPISSGSMTGTLVDPKKIFRKALEAHACSIILGHNHPSGNTQPSQADDQLTQNLVRTGRMLELPVLDHIIVGEASYYSYADNSRLTSGNNG